MGPFTGVRWLLHVLAIVVFALAAAGVPARVNLVALGLALWCAATAVGGIP
jgi:hypothetical protein